MYQPRRGALPAEADPIAVSTQSFSGQLGAPRRVASRPPSQLGLRAGIGVAALAITATAGTIAFTTSNAMVALPAPTSSPQGRDVAALNRSAVRTVQVRQLSESKLAEATADLTSVTPLYTTATLNLRKAASSKSDVVTSIAAGSKVLATSTIEGDYRKVETDKATGWVLAARLTDTAPDGVPSGFSAAPCAQGSAVEGRLRSDTIRIHRAVCALFPGVNSYGGWRAGG
ncbi:MAG: SH3 domain-containing protein, partial [Propionicimonas sp.]